MNNLMSLMSLPVIESKQNTQVKKLQKIVSSNKYRKENKLFWIEGEKLCKSFFENVKMNKKLLLVFDQKTNKKLIINFCLKNNIKEVNFTCLSSSLFREISQIENSPGWGIVANYPTNNFSETKEIKDLVILDGVQDPGNLGNIIRTSAAVGIENIWVTKSTSDPYSPKAIRAGSAGQFITKFSFFSDLNEILNRNEISKMQILATVAKSKSVNLYDTKLDLKKNCAWLFGSEGRGISSTAIEKNKLLSLNIPHLAKIESLNVAIAVAVCLFEMKRQRLS